jgi:hypothetical protein
VPIFDNTNNLLEHFGGLLRYTNGQYYLDLEEGENDIPNAANEVRNITNADFIGKIRLTDEGAKGSFNSLTVAYADPANKFEAKNISFFNSEFLKIDRNVPKKGSLSIPGITNYYNARLLSDKFLVKSRYGLTISFNMMPKGELLQAGSVIQVQYPKYGWVNKKFRIVNLTHNTDTSVDIVAEEYDDKFYLISNISRPPAAALAAESNTTFNVNPSGLSTTYVLNENEIIGGIELSWNGIKDLGVETEIYRAPVPDLFVTATGTNNLGQLNSATLFTGYAVEPFPVISKSATNGLELDKVYYLTVIDVDNFRISSQPTSGYLNFGNNSTLSLKFMTASLVDIVPGIVSNYTDVFSNPKPEVEVDPLAPVVELTLEQREAAERIVKYYWIRHKITKI